VKEAVVMLAIVLTCCCASSQAGAQLKAGAAKRVVTPDPLLPLSGGVGEPYPATEKKGELSVRALVLEEGDTRLAVVGADFLGWPGALCKKVHAQVKDIPADHILIGSTHTHSAPDTYAFADKEGRHGADLEYLDWVCAQMAEAINEAFATRRPATVRINVDKAKGKIAYNYYAPQLYDPRMGVMQFAAMDGAEVICTLVNYATHPEVLGPRQGICSPDCIGPMYDAAEKAGGVALFMNSAQGGMVTADCRGPNGDIQTWEECIRIGELMASEALRIAGEAKVQEAPALFCAAKTVTFPIESPLLRLVMRSSPLNFAGEDASSINARLNVVNLGDAQVLTIPGEALPNIGYYLKRNMHGRWAFLFGLTNDALGYMLAKVDWKSFDRYNYITQTGLGEMTGEILIEEGLKLVEASPRPGM